MEGCQPIGGASLSVSTTVVAIPGDCNVVHHGAKYVGPYRLQAAHGLPYRALTGILSIQYQEHTISLNGDYGRVRDHSHRRDIDQDVVELLSYTGKELREAPGAQNFRGIWRYGSCGYYLEPLHWLPPHLLQPTLPCQHVSHSL